MSTSNQATSQESGNEDYWLIRDDSPPSLPELPEDYAIYGPHGRPAVSITCPQCNRTSYNINDVKNGYCGFCHDWTRGTVNYGL